MFHFEPAVTDLRCGQPTKKGKPCRSHRYGGASACVVHTTDAERAEANRLMAEREAAMTAHISPFPVCWSWPVHEATLRRVTTGDGWEAMYDWQAGRCPACGCSPRGFVVDHDHISLFVRGFLCGSCNLREGRADRRSSHPVDRMLARYRRWCPTQILGFWRQYDHPLWGDQREPFVLPHIINLENSPVYGIAEAFEAGEES